MEIEFEVKEEKEPKNNHPSRGCFFRCEVNTNYGFNFWCCERIKSA